MGATQPHRGKEELPDGVVIAASFAFSWGWHSSLEACYRYWIVVLSFPNRKQKTKPAIETSRLHNTQEKHGGGDLNSDHVRI